jgi:TolB-like protein
MTGPASSYVGSHGYVFVSYAHSNSNVVYPEITDLQTLGVNVWYDEGIGVGLSWRDEVALAISECELFVFYLSTESVASSVCREELFLALSRERRLVVIHLEECDLSPGIELGLSDKQAILKYQLDDSEYSARLQATLKAFSLDAGEPIRRDQINTAVGGMAILPLTIIGNNEEATYLAEGIAEELLNGMARIDGLRVVSGFTFKNQNLDIRNIGLKFKVDNILNGSIQQSGQRIRINMRLTSTQGGETLWVDRFEFDMTDIFEVQDKVAGSVLDALRLKEASNKEVLKFGTNSVEAYEMFLRGLISKRKYERAGFEQAVEQFGRATEIDPSFARAWYMLGLCFWELTVFLGQNSELIGFAEEAFGQAKQLNYEPEIPWIQIERKLHPDQRPDQVDLVNEAVAILDEGTSAWQHYELVQIGRCLGAAGLYEAAHEYLSAYLEKVPLPVKEIDEVRDEANGLLPIVGRLSDAIAECDDYLTEFPEAQSTRLARCMLYSRTGQYEKAAADLTVLRDSRFSGFAQFYNLYWQDRLEDAGAFVSGILESTSLQLRFKFQVCALLGRFDDAVMYMRESAERGAPMFHIRMLVNNVLPDKQRLALEASAPFQTLLKDQGFSETWPVKLTATLNQRSNLTNVHVTLPPAT